VTHNEAMSIADFFTVRDATGRVEFRPTCHYAYHPANDAVLSCTRCSVRPAGGRSQRQHVLDEDEIVDGR
jgi:homospermidine synthase